MGCALRNVSLLRERLVDGQSLHLILDDPAAHSSFKKIAR